MVTAERPVVVPRSYFGYVFVDEKLPQGIERDVQWCGLLLQCEGCLFRASM